MYYSKYSSSDSDFYKYYREKYYEYEHHRDYLTIILKSLVIISLAGLISFGYLYILNKKSDFKISSQKIVKENKQELTQDEIAEIVSKVMENIDKNKKKET